ncbi:MAG: hypothetical protein JJU33_04200 [Phycisphaerales bacterium]|nr:hypothetical protein [Phycisphaerales bacterium]
MQIGTTLNLFAIEAAVNGVSLPLTLGQAVEIERVNGSLITANLADGGAFSFQMNMLSSAPGQDFLSSLNTKIIATLVPSPGFAVGVCNRPRGSAKASAAHALPERLTGDLSGKSDKIRLNPLAHPCGF